MAGTMLGTSQEPTASVARPCVGQGPKHGTGNNQDTNKRSWDAGVADSSFNCSTAMRAPLDGHCYVTQTMEPCSLIHILKVRLKKTILKGWSFGTAIKPPVKIPASQAAVLGLSSAYTTSGSVMCSRGAADNSPGAWVPSTHRETQTESAASDYSWHLGSEPTDGRYVCIDL